MARIDFCCHPHQFYRVILSHGDESALAIQSDGDAMPSEIGVAAESAHETILDEMHGGDDRPDRGWIRWIALMAMILA